MEKLILVIIMSLAMISPAQAGARSINLAELKKACEGYPATSQCLKDGKILIMLAESITDTASYGEYLAALRKIDEAYPGISSKIKWID